MRTRLYVTNLPPEPGVAALRACFARCGDVSDVRVVVDRDAPRSRAAAYVTMSNEGEARRAVTEVHGSTLDGFILGVTLMTESPGQDERRNNSAAKRPEYEQRARITQQFRERENMTYELECSGTPLIVRVFFRVDEPPGEGFRIEVRTSDKPDSTCVDATAMSRLKALHDVAQKCNVEPASRELASIDWTAVEQAMLTVHAV